jgi:hypothetical protein
MLHRNRREFLADVGRGMLVASIGYVAANEMGLISALADEESKRLSFGSLEPLVGLMQDTPVKKLLPALAERLKSGTDLKQLVAAAALANARTFGGEDYVGFHTMMALAPSYHMSQEMPKEKQALPVFKVLYRNTNRIQEYGGSKAEKLHAIASDNGSSADCRKLSEDVRAAMHAKDLAKAERLYAAVQSMTAEDALNAILPTVQEATEVHRTVMPYRAWDLLPIVGREQAHTMLRQSVHYCVNAEKHERSVQYYSRSRTILPKLFDQYKLEGKALGTRKADDAWVEQLSQTIFKSTPEQAAEAAAAALAEGMDPDAVGEALALATNQLILRDEGRPANQTSDGKPVGSCHGDSIGVHACDSANAWRNMARVSNARNAMACLILGAYQACHDRSNRGGDFLRWQPYPRPEHMEKVTATDPAELIKELDGAIRENDQTRAAAVVGRLGQLGHPARPVFDVLLQYGISEDGALHAEKYYRTVTEEFNAGRPAFRWRQLVGLARVTASEYGRPAPGYKEACGLVGV